MADDRIAEALLNTFGAVDITVDVSGEKAQFTLDGTQFTAAVTTTKSGATKVEVTPETPVSFADMVGRAFREAAAPIVTTLTQGLLAQCGLESTSLTLPAQQDGTEDTEDTEEPAETAETAETAAGPLVEVTTILPDRYVVVPGFAWVKRGATVRFTCAAVPVLGVRHYVLGVAMEGRVHAADQDYELTLHSDDGTSWQLTIDAESGSGLPRIDHLTRQLGIEGSYKNTLKKALAAVGLKGFALEEVRLAVDFDTQELTEVTLGGEVDLVAGQARLGLEVEVMAKQASATLLEPARIALPGFLGDHGPDTGFAFSFRTFDMGIDLEAKSATLSGAVTPSSKDAHLKRLTGALGLAGAELDFDLSVSSEPQSLEFSAYSRIGDDRPATIPVSKLAGDLGAPRAVVNTFPPLGIAWPTIAVKKVAHDFEVSATSSLVDVESEADLGHMLFRFETKSEDGSGFAIGLDFDAGIDPTTLLPAPLPDFATIEDCFAVVSTFATDFEFPARPDDDPVTVTAAKNSFTLGCDVELSGKPGEYVGELLGGDVDLSVVGTVDFGNRQMSLEGALDATHAHLELPVHPIAGIPTIQMEKVKTQLLLTEDNVQVAFGAVFGIQISQTHIEVAGQLIVQENEVDVAVTKSGDPLTVFKIADYDFTLSDLAIEFGEGYEVVDPAFGLAGQVTAAGFNGYGAFLLDTAEGQNVMLVASANELPELSLLQALVKLCPKSEMTEDAGRVLDVFTISGTPVARFTPSGPEVLQALNGRRYSGEVAGQLGISDKKYYVGNTAGLGEGPPWFVTSKEKAEVYEILQEGAELVVTREPQLYAVPDGPVKIGDLTFPQGFRLSGAIRVFGFHADVDAASDSGGITVDADCDPVEFGVVKFFNPDPSKGHLGPTLHVDTHSAVPEIRLDAELDVLNMKSAATFEFGSAGISTRISKDVASYFRGDLTLVSDQWTSMTADADVELSMTVNVREPIRKAGVEILPAGEYGGFGFNGHFHLAISSEGSAVGQLSGGLVWKGEQVFDFNEGHTFTVTDMTNLAGDVAVWLEANLETVLARPLADVEKIAEEAWLGVAHLVEGFVEPDFEGALTWSTAEAAKVVQLAAQAATDVKAAYTAAHTEVTRIANEGIGIGAHLGEGAVHDVAGGAAEAGSAISSGASTVQSGASSAFHSISKHF